MSNTDLLFIIDRILGAYQAEEWGLVEVWMGVLDRVRLRATL